MAFALPSSIASQAMPFSKVVLITEGLPVPPGGESVPESPTWYPLVARWNSSIWFAIPGPCGGSSPIQFPFSLLRKVLDAGVHAPSGVNTQPWVFVAIQDPEGKRFLADHYREAIDLDATDLEDGARDLTRLQGVKFGGPRVTRESPS